jgi:small-conductance mechanosensitive channel/CRP-like cAMP-binding protein
MSAYTKVPIRLWAPTLLFAVFVAAAVFAPDLLARISVGGARLQELLGNGIHIGLWLSGAYLIVRLLNHVLWEGFVAHLIERPVPRLLRDSLAIVVFLLAAAGIVGVEFGQPVIGLWATSGAIGIILGIALRSIILDIFTGLAVNFDHSYRIGDWVELIERGLIQIRGKVVEINWRTTRLLTEDKRTMVVPNSRMGEMILANLSMPDDACRFETRITLEFSVHTERALRVMTAGAKAACGPGGPLHDPEPNVVVWGSSELGIEYRVRHWQRYDTIGEAPVRDAVMQSVLRHLAMAGLSPAYPKLDTFRAKMPTRQLAHNSVDDRGKLLRQLEIFDTLDDAQLDRLGADTQPQHFAAGDALTTQGAPRGPMFVLAEGLCEVWRTEDGAPTKIATIEPGDVIGEHSMLTGEPHSTTIKAQTEVVAYAIHPEHLAPLLADHPELYEQLSHNVAVRHLRFQQGLASADGAHHPHEVHSIAAQIVDRMRALFHPAGHDRVAMIEPAPAAPDPALPEPAISEAAMSEPRAPLRPVARQASRG